MASGKRRVRDQLSRYQRRAHLLTGRSLALALTLSKDGNPEIYVQDISSGRLRRLTVNGAIDTEPAWSPDGRWIAFTSDRGGSPQIYRVPADGSSARRARDASRAAYNSRPRYSPGRHQPRDGARQ